MITDLKPPQHNDECVSLPALVLWLSRKAVESGPFESPEAKAILGIATTLAKLGQQIKAESKPEPKPDKTVLASLKDKGSQFRPVDEPIETLWQDLQLGVIALPYEYWVEYRIFRINWFPTFTSGSEKPDYMQEDDMGHPVFVERWQEAYVWIAGSVKWDGCSNWVLPDHDSNCMTHFCGRDGIMALSEAMARCWDMTKTLCPKWSD